MTLANKDTQEEKVLSDPHDISLLRDYININIKIFAENDGGEVFSIPVKLQNKLSNELGEQVEAITGMTFGLFKFFCRSVVVNGDKFITSYPDIQDEMTLLAAAGFSKPFVFKRFKKPYEWPYWGYSLGTTDAMQFCPNKPVILYGFTLYATDQPQFEVKYKIYVDDQVKEEHEMTLSDWEDKYYKK